MLGWRAKLEKWRDIQTFSAATRWHFAYATRLLQACNRIARRLGQPNEELVYWHYEESPLFIECNGGYETRVLWQDQLVFLAFAKGNRNAQVEFQTLRVGAWIEQIIALEVRASNHHARPVDKDSEARERTESAFGRLPEEDSLAVPARCAPNSSVEFTGLRPNDTQPS